MQKTLMPLAWRKPMRLLIMIIASVTFSLGFACATPLAAFGVFAALTLNRRDAVLLAGTAWLANQAIGYTVLSYPVSADSLAWGLALGFATLFATLAAQRTGWLAQGFSQFAVPFVAFAAAFAVYEGTLFIAAVSFLGGTETFTIAIVARILEANAIAISMLLLLNYLGATIGAARKLELQQAAI